MDKKGKIIRHKKTNTWIFGGWRKQPI